jgi:hypothetical protein
MSYDFEWESGEMEDGNYEAFDSLEAPVHQPQRRRTGRFNGNGEMESGYDEIEGSYDQERSFGDYEGEAEYSDSEMEAEDAESVFDEMEEMDLAAELLSISDEQELDQFIGKIIRSAGKAVGSVISGPLGQALGSLLKSAARQSLPMFRGRGGGASERVFGLELEGLSSEDQEFESAKRYVRLGGAAGGRAARSPRRASPRMIARKSLMAAARRLAPGLLRSLYRRGRHGRPGYRRPYPPYGGAAAYPPYGQPYQQPQQQPSQQPHQYPGADQQGGPMSPMGGPPGGDMGQGQGAPDFSGGGSQDSGANGGFQGPMPQSGQWSRQGRQLTIHL